MKYTEFVAEFIKAYREHLVLTDLLNQDPYNVRKYIDRNPEMRIRLQNILQTNEFTRTFLNAKDVQEAVSCSSHIFDEIDKNSAFVSTGAVTTEFAHHHVDGLSKIRGILQFKNQAEYTQEFFFKDWRRYKPTVQVVEIYTKQDTTISNHSIIERPKFSIIEEKNRESVKFSRLLQIEKAFNENKKKIIEMHEKDIKPLLIKHKEFYENPRNSNVDLFADNKNFNHKNEAKNEFDLFLHKFKEKSNITF